MRVSTVLIEVLCLFFFDFSVPCSEFIWDVVGDGVEVVGVVEAVKEVRLPISWEVVDTVVTVVAII